MGVEEGNKTICSDSWIFKGKMKRDKIHGKGIVTYKNGNEDNVEFKMGKPVG